ncbi:MAG TPA: hypothetical protein VHB79_15075 [Polyangiaceae bacterium]|nr:hypothetical protein [Polyangiaceae bacterium]
MKYLALFTLGVLGLLPLACKDTDPCDPGQEIKGTGCFPIMSSDTGSTGDAGADAGGAAGVEPWGNPDATWGSHCDRNKDCGPDAPICATAPFNYCSQIDCQDGEANAGVCPDTWTCFKFEPYPAICTDPNHT